MKRIIKDTTIITIITLIAGILLGAVYSITKDPIAEQELKAKEKACREVFQDADTFGAYASIEEELLTYVTDECGYSAQLIDEIFTAKDASGQEIGYVLNVTSNEGYGGAITFAMGVSKDGTLNGISFLSIAETPGLGMKANTEEFKSQFVGKKADCLVFTKTGAAAENEIDAISGATVTTNAVTNGINAGLAAVKYLEGGNR